MFDKQRQANREQRRFLYRLLFFALGISALLAFLVTRLSFLTIQRGQELYELSENNFINRSKIPAPRGNIVDRNGRILATSEPRYNISISPFKIDRDLLEMSLSMIGEFCPQARVPSLDHVLRVRPRWKPITLASNLTMEQALPLLERQSLLPGVQVEQTFQRIYPHGRSASFLTGYVGKINERQLDEYLERGYGLDDVVGKTAIEKKYEHILKGEKGFEIVHRNSFGRVLDSHVTEEGKAHQGAEVRLTVDIRLQEKADALLEGYEGVIMAMDTRNGDILAMACRPNYDANEPQMIGRQGNTSWNRAMLTAMNPGSTFKMVTAAAWLLQGGSPSHEVTCWGHIQLGDTKLHCDNRYGHGPLQMREAIAKSCNIYFYDLARSLGQSRIVETGEYFGFGRPTGLALLDRHDSAGRLGDPMSRSLGDLVMMGIGQGRLISVTPIQMTRAFCALGNGGKLYTPQIVQRIKLPDGLMRDYPPIVAGEVPWTDEQHRVLMEAFRDVIDQPYGTGRHARFPEWMQVAGKTGSAERVRGKPTDAYFVCFSPAEDPEICVFVLLEHAGHGGEYASPLARQLLEKYYSLKKKQG
ncbi:MAG: penicillin-binding transpeptidase domain-containing protein [Candidatus Sumerlaeota bacterium]